MLSNVLVDVILTSDAGNVFKFGSLSVLLHFPVLDRFVWLWFN